jgi:OHCU decarboxylase
MAAQRPFASVEALHAAADDAWWSLGEDDWLEAFAAHPRIGERGKGWSNEEQAGTRSAAADVMATLARRNQDYEQRFRHVFLICATGRSADSMLADLERRMSNAPVEELRVAAGEQAKITHLRLAKLLSSPS